MNMLMIFSSSMRRRQKFHCLDVVKARFISKLYIFVELFLTCEKNPIHRYSSIRFLQKKFKDKFVIENHFLLPLKFFHQSFYKSKNILPFQIFQVKGQS